MSDVCSFPHPLRRDGASQRQRALAALDTSYARPDEREIADLLLYVRRYAELLRYYSPDNSPGGDWVDLIEHDASVAAAAIVDNDPEGLRRNFEKSCRHVLFPPPGWTREKAFTALLRHLVKLAKTFDRWYRDAVGRQGLKALLERLIGPLLSDALGQLLAFAGQARALGLLRAVPKAGEFSVVWGLDKDGGGPPGLPDLFPSGLPITEEEATAALEALIGIFEQFRKALSALGSEGSSALEETLDDHAAHSPHMALLLAFLQLLGHARDHLNTLGAEHLEFYYREVLGLEHRAAEPDRAHLAFGLAKGVSEHLLAADTELKAGKDATGVELVYATDGELVANRATLDPDHGLKTIFVKMSDSGVVEAIHAAPDADSADGLGTKIDDEEGKWYGFGIDKTPDDTEMPDAELGFAVASPMFFLAEGTRTITLTFELAAGTMVEEAEFGDHVAAFASGAKGWIKLTVDKVDLAAGTPSTLTCILELGPEAEAVVAYDSKALDDGFATSLPVVKLLLEHEDLPYRYIQGLEIASLTIKVDVDEVRDLILENDVGVLDPAKPFHPFGPVPRSGSSFLIGSPEVFQKRLTTLDLSVRWADLPTTSFATHYLGYDTTIADNGHFTATVGLLQNGGWEPPVASAQRLFDDSTVVEPAPSSKLLPDEELDLAFVFSSGERPSRPAELDDFTRFGPGLRQGFFRATLDTSFLHGEYPRLLAEAAIAGNLTLAPVPNAPYTPLMASLTLDYTAEEIVDGAASIERLFQVGPFGHREIDPAGGKLVPQFTVTVKESDGTSDESVTAEGTLLVGLDGLEPPQNLALLVQVAEGSEDPSEPVQEIVWSYLAEDEWEDFKTTEVLSDSTGGLLASGVIRFAVPEAATPARTILPAGLHWIKASVVTSSLAVPQLIALHPQAAVASFRHQGNDPGHLAQPLAAETIAKLRTRHAAVKSVTQPYASFGGRMEESAETFSLRVSERLRHKGRAITPFDYERLVLETFPEVYKVRCINHTRTLYHDDGTPRGDDEHAPGYVKLVVVPNLRNKNAVDPLKPRLSLHKLESIGLFLAEITSGFTVLEVANPAYEEIRVRFDVRFRVGRDKGFYTGQLEDDIVGFLSPWLHDAAADLTFGGRIHRSEILRYVEEREYVDFVTDFEMDHIVEGVTDPNVEEAATTRSSAALVSAPTHEIGDETVSCEDPPDSSGGTPEA